MGAVIVAGRTVPRPPEDDIWQVNTNHAPINALRMPVGGNFPFVPTRYRLDYDDPGVWNGQPQGPNRNLELASNLPPAKAKFWRNDTDDSSLWTGEPIGPTRGLLALQPATPLTPSRWKFDNDDGAAWYTKPGDIPQAYLPSYQSPTMAALYRPNPPIDDFTGRIARFPLSNLPITPGPPTMASLYVPNPPVDDLPMWHKVFNNTLIDAVPVVTPLVPQRWKFDYEDPAVWYTKPGAIPFVNLPPFSVTIPTMASLYTPNPYEYAPWDGNRISGVSNFILSNTFQLYPASGTIDTSVPDDRGWDGRPRPVNFQLANALPPVPPPAHAAVGWPNKRLSRKRWDELYEEERAAKAEPTYEEFERLIKPSKSKKAVKARKEVVRAAVEAVEDGLLSELNAQPLVEAVNQALTASKVVDVLEYAQQAREYIDRLREEEDEETVLKLAMTLL